MAGKTFSNTLSSILTDRFDSNIKRSQVYELIKIFHIISTANLSHTKSSIISYHLNSANEL
jgi:hypothetical protein